MKTNNILDKIIYDIIYFTKTQNTFSSTYQHSRNSLNIYLNIKTLNDIESFWLAITDYLEKNIHKQNKLDNFRLLELIKNCDNSDMEDSTNRIEKCFLWISKVDNVSDRFLLVSLGAHYYHYYHKDIEESYNTYSKTHQIILRDFF